MLALASLVSKHVYLSLKLMRELGVFTSSWELPDMGSAISGTALLAAAIAVDDTVADRGPLGWEGSPLKR